MLIRASCKTLDPVNPFCALLVNLSEMVSSRFLIALEITLYTQLSKLMGLQFLILVASPFFGINLIVPDLNELVSLPTLKQWTEYLCKGTLKNLQNFFRKVLLRPSAPPAVTKEKEILRSTVAEQAEELAELRNSLNDREQYARNWSMRILNIPIPKQSEADTRFVMNTVYEALIYPILEGAKANGDIDHVPECDVLLETAHILPGKGDGAKPIIARFYSRYWRNLVFRNRKEFAPREAGSTAVSNTRSSTSRVSRMKFPFFEDLTRATFKKLGDIKKLERVSSAWTVNGSIRFKIKDNDTIFKVSSINESVDDIVG